MVTFLSTGPAQDKHRVVVLQNMLEVTELKLQTLYHLIAENGPLCTDASRLKGSVKTLGRKRREAVKLTQKGRVLDANFKKIWADIEERGKRKTELMCEVGEKGMLAIM